MSANPGRGRGRSGRAGRTNHQEARGGRSNRRTGRRVITNDDKFTGRETELKGYIFDCSGSGKQIDNFTKTMKEISSYVSTNYKEGHALQYLIENDVLPTLDKPVSIGAGADDIDLLIQKQEVNMYVKKRADRDDATAKLYALIWGQCTNAMQESIKTTETYKETNLKKDVVELIKTIKGITFNFKETNYLPKSLWNAQASYYRNHQREEVGNQAFLDRYNNSIEVIEGYGGNVGNHQALLETDEIYQAQLKDPSLKPATLTQGLLEALERCREKYLAYGFLNGLDKK